MMPFLPMRRGYGILLVLFLLPGPVRAQQTSAAQGPRSLAQSLEGSAKEAYDAAKVLVANGNFEGALGKFQQAYTTSSDARLLYDMAICEKNLNHYASMRGLLQRYLQEGGHLISAEQRRMVSEALAAIQGVVGSVSLTCNEPGADVRVDGESAGTTPLAFALVVDPGRHLLTVQKPGFYPVERYIDVSSGSGVAADVALYSTSRSARLVVKSDESATVAIDGAVVARGRFEGRLAPGLHEVRVSEPDRATHQEKVELREGEMRTLDWTPRGDQHPLVWPWVVGGAVLVAGAAVLGGYALSARTPEQTAPQAGSLGSIQFQAWRR